MSRGRTVDVGRVLEARATQQHVLRVERLRLALAVVTRHHDAPDEAVEVDDWLLTLDLGVDGLEAAVALQVLRLVDGVERLTTPQISTLVSFFSLINTSHKRYVKQHALYTMVSNVTA